jgi:hypothetical protein
MINIIYLYKEEDLLNPFIERQIAEAKLPEDSYSSFSINQNPELAEIHDITHHHTVLFTNVENKVIAKLNGPFSTAELTATISVLRQLI